MDKKFIYDMLTDLDEQQEYVKGGLKSIHYYVTQIRKELKR